MWDLVVLVPDQCLSFYFKLMSMIYPSICGCILLTEPVYINLLECQSVEGMHTVQKSSPYGCLGIP